MNYKDLQRLLLELKIDAQIIELKESSHTAAEAAKALNTDIKNIVKSLVFIADGQPVVAMVSGPDLVDPEKVAKELSAKSCRIATAEEVKEITGYAIGGVPPVTLNLPVLIDEAIMTREIVYGGAGSGRHVIKLTPKTILECNDARIAAIAK